MNDQSKNTVVNVVAVVMLMLGGALRGAFDDQWFGDPLGYSVSAIAFLLWSHKNKWFWPEGGAPEWEKLKREGLTRYMSHWLLFALFITVPLVPILYVLHLILDGPSRTASLFNYIKFSLIGGATLGVLLGVWAWLSCHLIYRASRSLASREPTTEK